MGATHVTGILMPLLGLENYGSDDDEAATTQTAPQRPPQTTTKRKPVKFTVELPKSLDGDGKDLDGPRPAKRPRAVGSGKSTLLNMLPPPTKVTLVPGASTSTEDSGKISDGLSNPGVHAGEDSTIMIPLSVQKAPSSRTDAGPSHDFFSLGSSGSKASTPSGGSAIPSIASAPAVTDYQPPEPTAEDQYPGYYQLPSGKWAQYDLEYYKSFWEKKQEEWDALYAGHAEKGFENAQEEAKDVSAADQLNHAQTLREEKKNLTRNANTGPLKPNMKMEVHTILPITTDYLFTIALQAPKGSRARYRHQLTALLSEAYEKREELEEKIAQARRNKKDAGNKYGALLLQPATLD
jgi:proline-rich protein PRCC